MISPKVRWFALYTLVNVLASTVDVASFLTLTHLFGMPILQSIVGYSLAMLVNYKLQREFVFVKSTSKSEYRVFIEFVGTGLFGLASTACVIWFTMHILSFSPVVAKTLSLMVCFVVLYIARSRIVFSGNAKPSSPDVVDDDVSPAYTRPLNQVSRNEPSVISPLPARRHSNALGPNVIVMVTSPHPALARIASDRVRLNRMARRASSEYAEASAASAHFK